MHVLHLAAAAGIGLKPKMRARRTHPLRRFDVNIGQRALIKAAFAAVNVGTDHLKRQRAVDKHNFAVAAVGNTLGFKVKGFDCQPALRQGGGGGFGRGGFLHPPIVSGQRAGRYLDGSTGLPCLRTSKCSLVRSASVLPISAIFWPFFTTWSSLTRSVWLWA